MDPDANLKEQRDLIAAFRRGVLPASGVLCLTELVDALDRWLSGGGFLPEAWRIKAGGDGD